MCAATTRLTRGTIGLGRFSVSGLSREPSPPAMMMAFTSVLACFNSRRGDSPGDQAPRTACDDDDKQKRAQGQGSGIGIGQHAIERQPDGDERGDDADEHGSAQDAAHAGQQVRRRGGSGRGGGRRSRLGFIRHAIVPSGYGELFLLRRLYNSWKAREKARSCSPPPAFILQLSSGLLVSLRETSNPSSFISPSTPVPCRPCRSASGESSRARPP